MVYRSQGLELRNTGLQYAFHFAFQVQNVVLQIFANKDLHPELRMVSWIVLFETKPSMGLVITLARALQKEPNLQVASLVYSHMKALTRSTHLEFALM